MVNKYALHVFETLWEGEGEEAKRFIRISFSNISRISIVLPSTPGVIAYITFGFAIEWFLPINYNNNG